MNEKDYFSREEFFAKEPAGFVVMPLDMSLAKAQYELLEMVRNRNNYINVSFETNYTFKSQRLSLAKINIRCSQIKGSTEMYEVVMRVEDKEKENFAYGWVTMGTLDEIEKMLHSSLFVPSCKRWVKWLDYARTHYPIDDGTLYYWTEWQPISAIGNIYRDDPDLYGICYNHVHELKCTLRHYYDQIQPGERFFPKDMVMSCSNPGAPGDEDKFSSMQLRLLCFTTGRIDLVGEIVYNENFTYIRKRIIIHSFDSIEKCLWWLDRGSATADDCHLKMGELLTCG